MLGIVEGWPFKHGQITKSGLSNGRGVKFLLSVAVFAYDWLRTEGYLGKVR